ncbi:MAG TPA: DUF4886 domain-containing protein [Burkholderiaceae bacterium]|nr:DUF4886 domain-containing protein [Burkholderiaceae bacterium]
MRSPVRLTHWLTSAALALMLSACAQTPPATPAATAASRTPPQSMLWVGNSFFYYNNSMHGHVGNLLRASAEGNRGWRQTSATISGSGLNWHDMESHFKEGGMGSYSFAAGNTVVFNTGERKLPKLWDAVLMMDCSQCPVHPELSPLFEASVAKNAAITRKHGAEPILFMSWAYQDAPEMTATLADAYLKMAAAHQTRVVPAGPAFARSIAKRPDLNLYVADKRHPSPAGTYLAACTVLASVYRINPVGNSYTAGLPADVVAHLQGIAAETVRDFDSGARR